MTIQPSTPRSEFIAAALLLAVSLFLFYGTIIRIDYPATPFFDLPPETDGEEYFAAAMALYEEGSFSLHLAGREYPPRYPFGFSLVMVPFLAMSDRPVAAPFLLNQVVGLLILTTVFLAGWAASGPLAGGLASLLIVSFPGFIILARSPLSDLASALIILLGCLAIFGFCTGGSVVWGALGSFLIGLSICFRINNVLLFSVVILPSLLWPAGSQPMGNRLKATVLFATAFATGLMPLLVYNFIVFGGPLRTGYAFWVPYWADIQNSFHHQFLVTNLQYWWDELLQLEEQFTVANLFGEGSYFGLTFLLLAGLALFLGLRNTNLPYRRSAHQIFQFDSGHWTLLALGLPGLLFAVSLAFYFFQDARLLFPLFVVAIPFMSISLASFFLRSSDNHLLKSLAILLIAAQVVGYPTSRGSVEIRKYLDPHRLRGPAPKYEAVRALNELRRGEPSLILCDINPPYVYALTEGSRIVSPLNETHDYRYSPNVFSFSPDQRLEQIESAVSRGWTVYVLMARTEMTQEDLKRVLPTASNSEWQFLYRGRDKVRIARLVWETDVAAVL